MEPKNELFDRDVRDSFARQTFMTLLGARLGAIRPGEVDIELPYREDLVQQNGSLHAGVIASIADSACGYAAFTLMPHGSNVLSIEFKLSLLAPAAGSLFLASGRVLRAGRTITFTGCDVLADGKLVATMLATMIRK